MSLRQGSIVYIMKSDIFNHLLHKSTFDDLMLLSAVFSKNFQQPNRKIEISIIVTLLQAVVLAQMATIFYFSPWQFHFSYMSDVCHWHNCAIDWLLTARVQVLNVNTCWLILSIRFGRLLICKYRRLKTSWVTRFRDPSYSLKNP